MALAVAKVPFDAPEAELLSSGVPRGYKQLTTATSKLVKAGWLVKERSGWTATGEGVRALAAFPGAETFVDAMISGKPVPEAAPEQSSQEPQAQEEPAPAGNDAWQDQPQSVTLAGDFNPLFGEAGHWTTNLHGLQLAYDTVENVWKQTLQLPAGTYQYKIVVNGSWDENYGAFGVRDGANHELRLLSDAAVTFRFNFATKDIETS